MVDMDVKVIVGVGRFKHEQALEIAAVGKAVRYGGIPEEEPEHSSGHCTSFSEAGSPSERRTLAGGFPGKKTIDVLGVV